MKIRDYSVDKRSTSIWLMLGEMAAFVRMNLLLGERRYGEQFY